MNKKVSLKDVAKHVGVSTALVSYVINNKEKEARVGAEMVKRIKNAVKELNYQPNLIAKSLKSGRTSTIGLIVADISNPFFSTIARIIEDEARKLGYVVIFGSSDESDEKSQALIEVLLNRQVDAFIIAPARNTEKQVLQLQKRNIPVVLIDRYFPKIDVDSVHINNAQAAFDAVDYLVKKGQKRVAMVSYDTTLAHIEERKMGYKDALKKNGLRYNAALVKNISFQHLEKDVAAKVEELLKIKPAVNAFFFATNTLAVESLKVINRHNIRIPEDVAIVSFDESEAFDFFYAPLSYVQQPLEEIGKQAITLVSERLHKPSATDIKTIVLDAKLVIRKS